MKEPKLKKTPSTPATTFTSTTTIPTNTKLPLLLAFISGWADVLSVKSFKMYSNMMTGNWVNLSSRIVSQDYADMALVAATLFVFSVGYAIFRYVDRLRSKTNMQLLAVVLFALFSTVDKLRNDDPVARWPVLLIASGSGVANALSASSSVKVTNMMTGHLMKISSDVADYAYRGTTAQQLKGTYVSVRVIFCFCSGAALCVWCNLQHQYMFTMIGAMYAAIIVVYSQ